MANYFHFTLGPVQGFVSQARRTRDFWAGSFLLSWLAGVAIAEVKRQGGEITFPQPEEDYLNAITGKSLHNPPRQGGIPNRFKAYSAKVPTVFDGALVAQTIRQAWTCLAQHIWARDDLESIQQSQTRVIWDRQHQHFWEISWAITADENASAILDERKNWRTHYPQNEAGVKCMVMDGWQELSGAVRPGIELKNFWDALRNRDMTGIKTDLAEDEFLCAKAYVKRRFVRHFDSFSATLKSGLELKGWKLKAGMPSVSYMAAVHWLNHLALQLSTQDLQKLFDAALKVSTHLDEYDTQIQLLQDTIYKQNQDEKRRKLLKDFFSLDGNLFFEHVQQNPKAYGYKPNEMADFKKIIAQLNKNSDNSAPSPFYALLLMDGDSLGSHMSDVNKQVSISTALNKFTRAVPEIINSNNGFLIYAGGDDVLALLPLEDAIPCAQKVRDLYLRCFENSAILTTIPTTISAAIEFAHVKTPLTKILTDAHQLLDDIAKDKTGRDALAVRVWKTGGLVLEWAQPWAVIVENDKLKFEQCIEQFKNTADNNPQFSSKFFHKIRQRFTLLNPTNDEQGNPLPALLNESDAIALLAVDFVNSADNKQLNLTQAEQIITPLLTLCRSVTREPNQPQQHWKKSATLQADGALLIKFLAEKGANE